MNSPKTPRVKTSTERRDEKLEELARSILTLTAAAIARNWSDERDEVLQHFLFTALETHEADVTAGKPEEEQFLYQTDAYIKTRCVWKYKADRKRTLRMVELDDQNPRAAMAAWRSPGRSTREERAVTRMDVRNVLRMLDPTQARWCRLLMRGFRKGEAGRMAGGWSAYQTTMQRYRIKEVFAAAGVTP